MLTPKGKGYWGWKKLNHQSLVSILIATNPENKVIAAVRKSAYWW